MNAHIRLMMGRSSYEGISINDLSLSGRAMNTLKSRQLHTIGEILTFIHRPYYLKRDGHSIERVYIRRYQGRGKWALLAIRNCGRKTAEQIANALVKNGVDPATLDGKYPY